MSRYCLDTSAYSNLRKGDSQVSDIVSHAEWIGVPAIAIGELLGGFLVGARGEWNETRLNGFLASPQVEVLVVDAEVARCYGRIYAELRRAGRPVPENEMWIAAIATRHDVPVLTYDRHFAVIDSVASIILEPPR